MSAPETKRVLAALTREGADVRFVGGCVRNALLGAPVIDIDIATQDEPQKVIELLEAAGIRAVPTGLAHGTVTAVADHRHFEVTSLRRDVSTDGRRAVVAFTRDFAQDAARRDFTINAIYAAPDGALFDPVGGVADLEAGRVRFIGEASQRIAEDYLRILRFFRMHAWYGRGPIDREGLAASAAAADGLARLSAERVQKELFQLLKAPAPVPVLRQMAAAGVLARVLPEAMHLDRLERLSVIETREGLEACAVRRLAALIFLSAQSASGLSTRLKLSSHDRKRLAAMATNLHSAAIPDRREPPYPGSSEAENLDRAALAEPASGITAEEEQALKRALYALGKDTFIDALLLSFAGDPEPTHEARWHTLFHFARDWQRPVFPVRGRDLVRAGIPHGAEVGHFLSRLEQWWIDEGFAPGRAALLAKLKELRAP